MSVNDVQEKKKVRKIMLIRYTTIIKVEIKEHLEDFKVSLNLLGLNEATNLISLRLRFWADYVAFAL